ncbi:MAG: ParA family protein [Breznakia sp.]
MKTISILNMKGGVGKTTTSINLATGLAVKNYTVLIIDLDPQANSTDFYLKNKNYVFIDQMLHGHDVHVYETRIDNLSFIPSRLELALAEKQILLDNKAQHNRLYKVIKKVKDNFDYIIIDCPPILNLLTVNALNASDEVIIPIKVDKGAEKGFKITLQNIQEIADSYDLDIDHKILFTMVNKNNTDKQRIEDITANRKNHIIKTQIRYQSKPITSSAYFTEAVINGNSNVGADYLQLVKEILRKDKKDE